MLHINVPAGIGDISWSYSKLADLKEELIVQISADNPQRSLEYVKLLPGVVKAQYTPKNFHCIVDNSIPFTTTKQEFLDAARKDYVNFSPNRFLEAGHRLETWIPELPTNLHYNINTKPLDNTIWPNITGNPSSLFGIFTSSYHSIAHWGGWHLKEWKEFIQYMHNRLPSLMFVIIGASFDKPFCDDLTSLMPDFPLINLADKTNSNDVIEVIKKLKYLIAFPSGLPVLANVVGTPTMMFYPSFLWKIHNSWCDPKTIDDLTYKGCVFPKVKEATDWLFKEYKLKDKI